MTKNLRMGLGHGICSQLEDSLLFAASQAVACYVSSMTDRALGCKKYLN
jgi:hypothetical protein